VQAFNVREGMGRRRDDTLPRRFREKTLPRGSQQGQRVFGERVAARRFPNMVREMLLKASLCNLFMSLNPMPGESMV